MSKASPYRQARNVSAREKRQKGVHTSFGGSDGRSIAGKEITSRSPKAGNKYLKEMHHERGKEMHREKLKELKEMPKPNLPKSEGKKMKAKTPKNLKMPKKLKVKGVKRLKSYMQKSKDRCWEGYEPTPGKKPYTKGSCKKKG
jgi:hypothetical protein